MSTIERLCADRGKAFRDPVWEYIYLSPEMVDLVDTPDFQRLRHISQLGHVSLVYPGARHSRFEHSLGVYHLTKTFLRQLISPSPGLEVDEDDVKVCLAAALLHDIGHYPYSHILEEMQMSFFVHHEERGRRIICDPSGAIYSVLHDRWNIDPERVANVIDYRRTDIDVPERDLLLARILSGTLDPDKIDYLLRDSLYCGVPFGTSVNRSRLVNSICYDPRRRRLAITYKGVSAIESLIFTNYLMYRNVYWHHSVRAAVAMFKRVLQELLLHPDCPLTEGDFARITEPALVELMRRNLVALGMTRALELFERTQERRLFKVGRGIYSHEKKQDFMHFFYSLYRSPALRREKEEELVQIFSQRLGRDLAPASILIDIPCFGKSLEIDLHVFMGRRARAAGADESVEFGHPDVSRLKEYLVDNFEEHAKIFRVFCEPDDDLVDAVSARVIDFLK